MPRPTLLAALAVLAALALRPGAAAAQDRQTLHWDEIRVEARLDADGSLQVREHQAMVFNGAWNGGERVFTVRAGQRLRLRSIGRVDPATGAVRPLREDADLNDVDDYARDGDRVRWRSRLASAPPFRERRIEYVLDYVVENAVIPVDRGDGRYLLDHDFLFADRVGAVDRFALRLALDEPWAAGAGFEGQWEASGIPPGRGFGIHAPLRYGGGGAPAGVPVTVPPWARAALILLMLAGAAVLVRRFFRQETDSGRFAPLPEVTGEGWLEEHVFRYRPEVVGAAWDRSTSAPEVAGLLARLVQEGKLGSRVETDDGDDPVLHLELKVPRDAFDEAERPLIDALFFKGRDRTDTAAIKAHYKKSGFDPAGTIRAALERRIEALPGTGRRPRGAWPAARALTGAVLVLGAAALLRPGDAPLVAVSLAFAAGAWLIGLAVAHHYARAVIRLRWIGAALVLLTGLMLLELAFLISGVYETTAPASSMSPYYRASPLALAGLAALGVAATAFLMRMARPTELPERLALRRRLAAAHAWLEDELDRPEPDLRDEWFPYLLAFGLGSHVDRWFKAHAPSRDTVAAGTLAGSHAASGGSRGSWTGGGVTFGGGGGFAGGGVGASWGVAASTVASGVASPSSSGGSSGGGSSSGGGGGGGW